MATLTNEASSMSALPISPVTLNAISSPGSAGGPWQFDLLGYPTTADSGPDRVPASPSASPATAKVSPTPGISGPSGSISSASAALQKSLASKLRQRPFGSTECVLTWKVKVTPSGRQFCQLAASMPRISETDGGLWPTHRASDAGPDVAKIDRSKTGLALPAAALLTEGSPWASPAARDYRHPNAKPYAQRGGGKKGEQLPNQAAQASTWSTPRASDGEKGGPNMSFGAGGVPLPAQAAQVSAWPTPTSLSPAKDGNNEAGNSAGLVAIRKHAMAAETAMDTSPSVACATVGQTSRSGERKDELLLGGLARSMSPAPTESRGGLNPEFVCWLQGYPAEWLFHAPANKPKPRFKMKSDG